MNDQVQAGKAAPGAAKSKPAAATADEAFPTIKADKARLRDFTNNTWRVGLPPGMTPDHLEQPAAWANLNELRPFDEVLAISDDASWIAYVFIADAMPGCVRARVVNVVKLPPRLVGHVPGIPAGYDIRRTDANDVDSGYLIERLKDGVIMQTGLPDFETARRHLVDHASLRPEGHVSYVP